MSDQTWTPPRLLMSYAGSEWVERGIWKDKPMSPLGRAAADVLGLAYKGIYHLPGGCLRKVNWGHPHYVQVSVFKDISTWDDSELTRLVVVCHDLLLRLDVNPAGSFHLRLGFSQRRTRTGSIMDRIPTIEEHVTLIRRQYEIADGLDSLAQDVGT